MSVWTCRRQHSLFISMPTILTAPRILLDFLVTLLPIYMQCATQLLLYGHTERTIETNNLIFENVCI